MPKSMRSRQSKARTSASIEASPPEVVALVLNWCAEEDTARCVASLEQQDYAPLRICILDNASADGSGERLQRTHPRHDFIQTGSNLGYAGGNDIGIAHALARGADYVLVINDDAELSEGCLQLLVDALEAVPDAAISAPTITHRDEPHRIWWAGGQVVHWKAVGDHPLFGSTVFPEGAPVDVGFVSGCIMLIRGSALREAGGFDPVFVSYVEDVDLSLRYLARGWRLLHVPAARAMHAVPWPPAPPSDFAVEYRDRNRRRVARRHLSATQRLVFRTWFYPTRGALIFRALLRGSSSTARALLRGAFSRLD